MVFDYDAYKKEFNYVPESKWKDLLMDVEGNTVNETLSDDKPYNSDTILTYEDHLRTKAAPLY